MLRRSSLSRRTFLKLVTAGTAASACAATSLARAEGLELNEIPVRLPALPDAFHNFKIGFLTDVHLGVYVPDEWVSDAIERLRAADVDLLLLGGDYISLADSLDPLGRALARNTNYLDCQPADLARCLFSSSARLLAAYQPPHGVAAVYGNHDRHILLDDRKTIFEAAGIRALVNETFTIERGDAKLVLIGVDDLWYGNAELPVLSARPEKEVREKQAKKEVRVLLSHNPDFISQCLATGCPSFDFALAGHTHGGQIKLPLIGAVEYNVDDARFREGLCRAGDACVYTSRGLGVVNLPWRVNCPPEVNVFTLQAGMTS